MAVHTPLDLIKRACNIPLNTDRFDALLDQLTATAETRIQKRYRIPLLPTTYNPDSYFGVESNGLLTLRYTPVLQISSITVWDYPTEVGPILLGPPTGQQLVTPDQYQLLDAKTGVIQFLVSSPYLPPGLEIAVMALPFMWGRVDVAYTAGFQQFPTEVNTAVAWLVQHWIERNGRNLDARIIHSGDYHVETWDTTGWPTAVSEILADFQPPEVGIV